MFASKTFHNQPAFCCDNMSQFKCPSSIIIAGPSQCGKTTFTRQLLQQADPLFDRPIRKIVYCYGQWQECFKNMAPRVTFVEGIPEDIPSLFPPNCRPGILILDDLMRNCSDDERILDLFTKASHHCDVTCIYLTQNLFPPGKFSQSISLNAHYVITFNNPRDTLGFRTLAQQAFAGRVPYVWESFQDATSKPFGYLVMDLHPRTPNIQRLRTNILSGSHSYPVIYVDKKTKKQMSHCLLISLNITTLHKSHRTMKRPRKNQRGGNMVLPSGTSTVLKGVSKRRLKIPKHSKVNQHFPFICTYFKSTGKQRKDMIAHANKGQMEAIGEIALNLLKGNVLKPHKSKLLYLTRKKPNLKKKKQVLNQKGGFLPALAS